MNERFKLVKEYIKNKEVLDIGCVDSIDPSLIEKYLDGWFHHNISKHAKRVVGIDINNEGVKELQRLGYDARYADAEDFNLNEKFDVIVAGEIIEHLTNLNGFFNSVKKHLREEGILIITTPNSFYFKGILFLLLRGRPSVNPEHVTRFDEVVIRQLLERFNFEVLEVIYTAEKGYLKSNIKGLVLDWFEKVIPFKKIRYGNIIVIAKNSSDGSHKIGARAASRHGTLNIS